MIDESKPVAFVTGGSRGIGRAISIRLAKDGYHVIVNYRERVADAHDACATIAQAGGTAEPMRADVTQEAAVAAAFQHVKKSLGRLDVLVNNAGILHEAPLALTSTQRFVEVMHANVLGTFLCSKYASRMMTLRRSGCIVNITSTAATRIPVGLVPYSVAKAAINALTVGFARELAGAGIRVNAIAPSYVETELLESASVAPLRGSRGGLQRFAKPDEIAAAVSAVIRDDLSYLVGAIIVVDGGRGS